MKNILLVFVMAILSGCSLGSGAACVSGLSIHSYSAEHLTPEGEEALMKRIQSKLVFENYDHE